MGANFDLVHVSCGHRTLPELRLSRDRAEVFALLIAGSLPTLEPILTLLKNYLHVPFSSHNSRKYSRELRGYLQTSSGTDLTTIGSKSTKTKLHRRAGNVTIDLDEIDKMATPNGDAASHTGLVVTEVNEQPAREGDSTSNVHNTRKPHGLCVHVQQEFEINHAVCSDSDMQAIQETKLPLQKWRLSDRMNLCG